MTENQQIEFNKLKTEVETSAKLLTDVHQKTERIFYALIGNDLSQDGGLVKQIKDMKTRQELFENEMSLRVEKLEKAFVRWKGIAFGLLISGGVIGYLLNIIVNKYL